jgi:hypothetical protein
LDHTINVHITKNGAHCINRRLIYSILIAPPHELARDDGRRLGSSQKLKLDASFNPPFHPSPNTFTYKHIPPLLFSTIYTEPSGGPGIGKECRPDSAIHLAGCSRDPAHVFAAIFRRLFVGASLLLPYSYSFP